MLFVLSLVIVCGYSFYFFISLRSEHHNGNQRFTKCIPMLLGMMSSLPVGLVIALYMPTKLALSTIIAVIVSAFLAFLVGRGFGISGIIEAVASSLMGAMMGAMLGAMLAENEVTLMVVAMDSLYLITILGVMILLKKENILKRQNIQLKMLSFYLTLVLSGSLIGLTALVQMITNEVPVEVQVQQHHH